MLTITAIGKCGHSFHMHCLQTWIQQDSAKGLCPMCRQSKSHNTAYESRLILFQSLISSKETNDAIQFFQLYKRVQSYVNVRSIRRMSFSHETCPLFLAFC